jgi:hypothetical protein
MTHARGALRRLAGVMGEHWLFTALLAVGALLRLVAFLAYRPALMYPDSVAYLQNSRALHPYLTRPLGYPFLLWLLPLHHDLALVPALQHLMGLGMALLVYVLLGRFGVPRWVAALACAPLLLDAYLIDIEEYMLSETLFHALLVGAAVALLWRRRPTVPLAALSGLLLAGVTLTRATGEVAIAAVLAAAIFLRPGWRAIAAMVAAAAVPIAAYAVWFHHVNGFYGVTGYGGRFLYARVAPFADCSKFSVPADEQTLCPTEPVGQRPTSAGSTVEFYMWDRQGSPIYKIPGGEDEKRKVAGAFARRVILHQPGTYIRTVLHGFSRGFAAIRTRHRGELPIARWQFVDHFPLISPFANDEVHHYDGTYGKARPRLTRALRAYQRFGFTPGPLLAIGLILGVLGSLGLGRARRSGLRTATFVFTALAILVFGASVAVNQFTWRYQLPLNILVPPAAALAAVALFRGPRSYISQEREIPCERKYACSALHPTPGGSS